MDGKRPSWYRLYEITPGRPKELDPVNLDQAQQVLQRTKLVVGVGPRGLRPGHPTPLSKGKPRGSKAQGTRGNFLHLGRLYFGGHMPTWARKIYNTSLLAPLIKKAALPGVISDSRSISAC